MKLFGKRFWQNFLKIPSVVWITLILEFGFIIIFSLKHITHTPSFIFSLEVIKTLLVVSVFFSIIEIILIRLRKLSGIINVLLIFVYTLLLLYHYHSGGSLDFLLLWHFRRDLFNSDVWVMVANYAGINTFIFLIILILSSVVAQVKWSLFSIRIKPRKPLLLFTILFVVLIVLSFVPVQSLDEISYFMKSVQSWYRIESVFSDADYSKIPKYPYVKLKNTKLSVRNRKKLPNVFFIVVESLNANFVEAKTNLGKEIMPFLDSLIQKGIYVEHFYGNSVITDKGHLSILFSILPSFRRVVFEDYKSDSFYSLAQIFKDLGYKTIFFQGGNNNSLKFGNEGPFLSKNGFDICKGTSAKTNKNRASYDFDDPNNKSGFGGFKDFVMYREFFETVDSLHQHFKIYNQKFFGFLATISSHSPWLRITGNDTLPYLHPSNVKEDYANTLFLVDSYLRVFFTELQKRSYLDNSIIIITGDHSQPMKEHGNTSRGIGGYEENFRTPLLMIWKNVLKPSRITNQAWSQIDIAPTLLDLLGIKVTNHFIGKSFLGQEKIVSHVVYLVQPFDGLYFSLIDYPYKYNLHISTNKEFLFNLEKDPTESVNLVGKLNSKLAFFRNRMSLFGLNEYLLQNNRIWFTK